MNDWLKKNAIGSLSLTAIIGLIYLIAQKEDLLFTTEGMRYETEKFIEDVDPIKAYGEYIIDSIEEVHTQAFRMEQRQKDTFYMKELDTIKEYLKLNIRISDETKKAAEKTAEGH